MSEPTPVRVRFAGETFTGRLLCAPNAIRLVEVENARERRSVPATWCEPLTDAARDLLTAGDKFVGEARDIARVLTTNPNEIRVLDVDGWTVDQLAMLRDFIVAEASRKVAAGKKANGWLQTARQAKKILSELRQRERATAAGITPEQRRDPSWLCRQATRLLYNLRGRLYKLNGGAHVFDPDEQAIVEAIAWYGDHYAEVPDVR